MVDDAVGTIIEEKEVELHGQKYTTYLKRVATRLGNAGKVESTTIKAYIKKCKKNK